MVTESHFFEAVALPERRPPRIGVQALLVVGAWSLFALFFISRSYLLLWYSGRPIALGYITSWMITAILWACLTPLVGFLAQKFPFTRLAWKKSAAVHAVASVLVSAVELFSHAALGRLIDGTWLNSKVWATLVHYFLSDLHTSVLLYVATLGMVLAINYHKLHATGEVKITEIALRAAILESQLANAQLQALRMQLHPHFLFNTLHSITALIRKGSYPEADSLVTGLSDLLRSVLDASDRTEIPLRDELSFVAQYLKIQKIRFGSRLQVVMKISPDTLRAMVPTFLLQPMVENAITHGIARSCDEGLIEIRARRIAKTLELQVLDNGPGLDEAPPGQNRGFGLRNTRERLEQLYSGSFSFAIENSVTGGTSVCIRFPMRLECAENASS